MSRPTAAQMRKFLIALVAFAANLVAQGILPDAATGYVTAVIAALAAIGVFVVPNAPTTEAGEGK